MTIPLNIWAATGSVRAYDVSERKWLFYYGLKTFNTRLVGINVNK